jgi:hypothetical protein
MSFSNHTKLLRSALSAMVLLAGLAWSQAAAAATIYNYTFEQTGWISTPSNDPVAGKIVGSFSGSPDTLGSFTRASLTEFHLELVDFDFFAGNSNLFGLGFFALILGDDSSFGYNTLVADTPGGFLHGACAGPAVGFICPNPGVTTRGDIYDFASKQSRYHSQSRAVLTLVSITTTPTPASVLLFGSALAGLAGLAVARRRSDARSAD